MVNRDDVGSRVRAAREARHMSMSDLARAAGLSPGAVSRLERGERAPGAATLAAIAKALGVEPGHLMGSSVALLPHPVPTPVIDGDREVIQAIELVARRMPTIPAAGRHRILGVILALLGDGDGRAD